MSDAIPIGPRSVARVTDRHALDQACLDCVPIVHHSRWNTIQDGPVLVVNAEHERSCPWFARIASTPAAPDGEALVYSEGAILRHTWLDVDDGLEADGDET